jgi:signal transduction histidine kinase
MSSKEKQHLITYVGYSLSTIDMTATSNDSAIEKTEVWHGRKEIMARGLTELSKVKERYDSILDANGPSIIMNNDFIVNAYVDIRKRGCDLRIITEINNDNLSSSKELAKYSELRHLDGVKGNLGIVDGMSYGAAATAEEKLFPTQYIYSTVRSFVEQQQYFFDMLWQKSIPAELRIQELEEGLEPVVIETIRNPTEIRKIGDALIGSAKDEILILYSTARAFYRQDKIGRIDALIRAIIHNPNLKLKILTPITDNLNKHALQKLNAVKEQNQTGSHIDIRQIEPTMQSRVTVLIIDRKYSLVIELKDDDKDESSKAIGLATYSNSGPTVLSYASIFESLWMQAELYKRIKEANNQLEVHDRLQREFINIAAHELRNPIQPILSLSEIVRSSEVDQGNKDLLDVIIRNAKKLRQLTEDVLDVTRIESKSFQLNKEEIDIENLAMHVLKDYQISTNNKIKLELIPNENSESHSGKGLVKNGQVIADRYRIQQVLSNLVDNAVKYTAEGGTISVSVKRNDSEASKDGMVTIRVKDTGSGIDPKIMPRLFTKFASSNTLTGIGLGLYISKSIVEAHGGEIWAENNEQGESGATFSFRISLR